MAKKKKPISSPKTMKTSKKFNEAVGRLGRIAIDTATFGGTFHSRALKCKKEGGKFMAGKCVKKKDVSPEKWEKIKKAKSAWK